MGSTTFTPAVPSSTAVSYTQSVMSPHARVSVVSTNSADQRLSNFAGCQVDEIPVYEQITDFMPGSDGIQTPLLI